MPIVNIDGNTDRKVNQARPVGLRYNGFSLREVTGTASAVVRIFDSMDASGPVLDEVSLGPGESAREFYPNIQASPLVANRGIYVQVAAGAVIGSVRYS